MKVSSIVLLFFCIWQIHSAPVPLEAQYEAAPAREEPQEVEEEVDVEREAEIPPEVEQQSQLPEERHHRAKRSAQQDDDDIDMDDFQAQVQRSRRHGFQRDYRLCFVPPFPLWCYDYHKRTTTTIPGTTTTTPFSDITFTTTRPTFPTYPTFTTTTTPFSDITFTTTRPTFPTYPTFTTTTTPFSDITFTPPTTTRPNCQWWWLCSRTSPFPTTTTTPFSDVPFTTTTTTPFSDITTGNVPRIRFEHAVVKGSKKLSKASNLFGYLKRYEQQY